VAGIGLEFRLNYSDKAVEKKRVSATVLYPYRWRFPPSSHFCHYIVVIASTANVYSLSLANFSETGRYILYDEWHTTRVFIRLPPPWAIRAAYNMYLYCMYTLYILTPSNLPSARALEIISWIIIILPGKPTAARRGVVALCLRSLKIN